MRSNSTLKKPDVQSVVTPPPKEHVEAGPRYVHLFISHGGTQFVCVPIHTDQLPWMIARIERAIKTKTWLKIPVPGEKYYSAINGTKIDAWQINEIRENLGFQYQQRLAAAMEKLADQQ